jgi:hypothetical protein
MFETLETRSLPVERVEADRAMLRAAMAGAHAPMRRRRWLVVGAAAGVALAGTGAGFIAEWHAEPSSRSVVRCHSTLEVGNREDFKGTSVSRLSAKGGLADVSDPVELCQSLWEQGMLRAGVMNAQAPTPGRRTDGPALTGCVDNEGIAAVFPTADPKVCAALGMASLP